MQLIDVYRTLRRNLWWALGAFLVVVALGGAAAYLPAPKYKSTASVLTVPDLQNAPTALQALDVQMRSLELTVGSAEFRQAALARLSATLQQAPVSIEVSSEPTGLLSISAVSTRASATRPWARAFAQELIEDPPPPNVYSYKSLGEPAVPTSPFSPQRNPLLFGAIVLGLIAGVLVALGIEVFRHREGGNEEIRRRFGKSVLGEIPAVRGRVRLSPAGVSSADLPVEFVEAMQSLRTNLEIALLGSLAGPIVVTSAGPGEGKSLVASFLGTMLASAGHPVTVIDADTRRPTQHTQFNLPLEPGLASSTGSAPPRHVSPDLDVLPAGIPSRHPAEVVAFNLPIVLHQVGRDRVAIIDSPPLEGLAETAAIAALGGRVLLVIDARRSEWHEVERTLSTLAERQATVVGVVINRARIPRRRRTSEYYRYQTPQIRPVAPTPVRPPRAEGAGSAERA